MGHRVQTQGDRNGQSVLSLEGQGSMGHGYKSGMANRNGLVAQTEKNVQGKGTTGEKTLNEEKERYPEAHNKRYATINLISFTMSCELLSI